MIKAEKLRKQFNTLVAVDDVSFDIAQGEVFGLLGPNGAGKTTTINMLVGVLKPDRGEVEIAGFKDPTRPELRNKIGAAPQSIAIYEKLTARENLLFLGKLYGLSGLVLEDRVDWALNFVGLKDREKDLAGNYSGGMQRRLNLAGAVVHDPPVLFFDEPTVGVDPHSRNMIFESIEQLKRDGRTIIYTTHYMEEAQRLCNRVAIIDHGEILALDTVDGLIEQHGGKALIEAEIINVPEDTSKLPGKLEGNVLTIETGTPMQDLARLTNEALNFTQLKVDRPNLETVFLNLTGRSLRDQ